MTQESLVHRFWVHVVLRPNQPAVLIKNTKPAEPIFVPATIELGLPPVVADEPSYRAVSWSQSGRIVAEIMAYLLSQGFRQGDHVAILGWNCPEWVWTDLAVQSLGGVTVPIYPNTSSEGTCFVLNDCGAKFLFADDAEQLAKADESLLAAPLTHKALFGAALKNAGDYTSGWKPFQFSVVAHQILDDLRLWIARGYAAYDDPDYIQDVDPDGVATIIYTSGSTGRQKGVRLTHGNIAAALTALMRHGFDFNETDTYLSYLPLAHVYERFNGQAMCIWNAVPTAFCKVDELSEAVKLVRPTILVGVPAVWRKVKDKVDAEFRAATGVKAGLIAWALTANKPGLKRFLADRLVFKKVRAGLGGRLRLIMSGGAAIDPDVIEFFNLVGLSLRQGYGLTETTGGIAAETAEHSRYGSVGKLVDCVEIKLVSDTDNPDPKKCLIMLRGDSIFQGYHNLPEATAESIDGEGWFNSGDLGYVDQDGYLFITGRKKRQGKTEGGKYYSPEKIENAFDGSSVVQYVVPTGDGKPFIGALIFVNQVEAAALLRQKNAVAADVASHPVIVEAVAQAVEAANAKLEHWEMVKQYEIVASEATVESGLVTPTLKIRSEEVLKRFPALVDAIYSRKR